MPEDSLDISEDLGHEPTAMNTRPLVIGMATLFGVVIVALLLIAGFLMYLASRRGGDPTVGPVGPPVESPPGIPALDSSQSDDLHVLRARENKLLTEYSWVDPQAGVARIPIGRAMEILSQRPTPSPQLPSDDSNDR